jgi:hypothetical protein
MSENKELDLIIQLFETVSQDRTSGKCGNLFCSTCGGVVSAIYEKMDKDSFHVFAEAIDGISEEDKTRLLKWRQVIEFVLNHINQNHTGHDLLSSNCDFVTVDQYFIKLSQLEVGASNNIQQAALETLDLHDIREVDRYIYKYKSTLHENSTVLQQGIKLALQYEDSSLTETLTIVLGKKIMDTPELLELGLSLAKENRQLQRVLYNLFREELVEVRGFVGEGNTVDPFLLM